MNNYSEDKPFRKQFHKPFRKPGFPQDRPQSKSQVVYEGTSPVTGKDMVRLIMLGGAGNVTKNMYAYEYRVDGVIRDILLVDCGIGFPDPEMYGVDLVIPDIRYLADKIDKVRGLIFTHGHDDHIGAIPFLYPKLGNIKMWGTPLTAAFANIKLKEAKLKGRVTPVSFDTTLNLGAFSVSFIRVTHSVPDTSHLVIRTPVGTIYHGSDYKFDPTPLDGKTSEIEKINRAGRDGVLLMLTDCLGSERPGMTESEQMIRGAIERELDLCSGAFIFTTQSSNISRLQLAIEIAIAKGRKIALFGRSINQNIEASVDLGYMKIPREYFVRDRDLKKLPKSKQFLIVAGAQAQSESALYRIANGTHQYVQIGEGDTVMISADIIPGNENSVHLLIDELFRTGVRVVYSGVDEGLHVSGHGHQGDHVMLLSAVGPKYILPIGGTYRHIMNYRAVAQDVGYQKNQVLIPDDGQVIELRSHMPPRFGETMNLDNVLVDGLGVGDVGAVVLHDRQTIAKEGIIVVVVPVDGSTGKLVGEADIITRGVVYVKESGDLLKRARKIVTQVLLRRTGKVMDWRFIREEVENEMQRFIRKETGRQPLIVPVVFDI